jgi:hypothetical protein
VNCSRPQVRKAHSKVAIRPKIFLERGKARGERATLPGQMEENDQLTRLLEAWSCGDERAIDSLIPLVYSDLHRLAHRYLVDERPGHTLQTTALVNEAYLRLVDRAHANH